MQEKPVTQRMVERVGQKVIMCQPVAMVWIYIMNSLLLVAEIVVLTYYPMIREKVGPN